MTNGEEKLLETLLELLPTLQWLNEAEPVQVDMVPPEHLKPIKQLDNLGLVYKRNARTFGLQKERLKRLIRRVGGDMSQSSTIGEQLFTVSTLAAKAGVAPEPVAPAGKLQQ